MAVATMKLQTAVGRFVLFLRSVANRTGKTGLARTAGSLAFTTVLGLVSILAKCAWSSIPLITTGVSAGLYCIS